MNNVAQINPSIVYEPSQTTHWKNLFPNKTMLLGSHNLNEGEELVATDRSCGNARHQKCKWSARRSASNHFCKCPTNGNEHYQCKNHCLFVRP